MILTVLSAVSATYLFIANEKYRKKIKELEDNAEIFEWYYKKQINEDSKNFYKFEDENQVLTKENEKLASLSYKDQLTGCLNRNALERDRERLDKTENIVIIVDINNLKAINDKQGHEAGDKAIISVAKDLKRFGTVYRLGGDEFLLIMKDQELYRDGFNEFYKFATHQNRFAYGYYYRDEPKLKTLSEAMSFSDKEMYKCKKRQKRTKKGNY